MTKFYVYEIYNKITHKRYIGAKSTTGDPYTEIGKNYFSSSRDLDFKQDQRDNPDNYTYVVLAVFDNSEDADAHEHYLQKSFNVCKNDMFYNKITTSSKSGFSMYGKVTVKDKNGNTYVVEKTDPLYLSGELVHISSGKVTVMDAEGNVHYFDKDDPEYINGDFVGVNMGRKYVHNDSNELYVINPEDYLKKGYTLGKRKNS